MRILIMICMILTATTAYSAEVALQWDTVDGVAGYRLYQSTDGAKFDRVKETTQTIERLPIKIGVDYQWFVRSVNADGVESYNSNVVSKTLTRPDAPRLSIFEVIVGWLKRLFGIA